MNAAAKYDGGDLVVEYEGKNYSHFSLFTDSVKYYAVFERCIVTLKLEDGTLKCACRKQYFCTHKACVFWFLNSTRRLNLLLQQANEDPSKTINYCTENFPWPLSDEETPITPITPVYPPITNVAMKTFVDYIFQNKLIP